VRGIVASKLGRRYVGIDLRPEQIVANREQATAICSDPHPVWIEGDSASVNLATVVDDEMYDLVFSCPPYGNLERYSDDVRDLSTMEYEDFMAVYKIIITASCSVLKPDRFACFVVGDIRDKKGFYRNLPALTIQAFEECGVRLYNDAVLVTAAGSLPLRVGRQFEGARKLGKTHQNVLIFCKGNPKKATAAIGDVECGIDFDSPGVS